MHFWLYLDVQKYPRPRQRAPVVRESVNSKVLLRKSSITIQTMMPELPCAIEQRLGTSADLANVDESAVRPKIILVASRGDAAIFDP